MKYTKYQQDTFFNKIYNEMYKEVYHYIQKFIHDNRILDDILQDTFCEAYKHIDMLMDHENYRGWIYKTAKFKALKAYRQIHNIDDKQVDILYAEIQEVGKQDEYNYITYADLKDILSPEEYNLFMKHYIEGYTFEELAKQENIKVGTSKMRVNRIIKKLRKATNTNE